VSEPSAELRRRTPVWFYAFDLPYFEDRDLWGLIGMGIPEYEAKRYEGMIRNGGILLSVHCDSSDWEKRAKDLLHTTGAQDISSTSEAGADCAKSDKPKVRYGDHGL
jgi:hypothetical protein